MVKKTTPNVGIASCVVAACFISLIAPVCGYTANWTVVTALPPDGQVGTMLLLTDGTVMMENYGGPGWLRLTPDATGNYATGSWSPTSPMSQARLFFASQMLPSGKLWVLGGEYTGGSTNAIQRTDTPTSEIYDPITNKWSTAARYPDQPGLCGSNTLHFDGKVTNGSNVITGIPITADLYVGWSVSGTGIPAGATITSLVQPLRSTSPATRRLLMMRTR